MRTIDPARVLLLPGWQNSGPTHWQSRWEALYGYQRVQQHDWMRPLRGDWITRLEDVLLAQSGPCILVAHSLGCMLCAAWASVTPHPHRVAAALLVAPGDPQREELRAPLHSWVPVPREPLPFPSLVLGSHNDPYCTIERARGFAQSWGSHFVDYGHCGHINAASNLGDWPEGLEFLHQLHKGSTPWSPKNPRA